jgi:hypothetical protein
MQALLSVAGVQAMLSSSSLSPMVFNSELRADLAAGALNAQ